jgi:hypothetical protein
MDDLDYFKRIRGLRCFRCLSRASLPLFFFSSLSSFTTHISSPYDGRCKPKAKRNDHQASARHTLELENQDCFSEAKGNQYVFVLSLASTICMTI